MLAHPGDVGSAVLSWRPSGDVACQEPDGAGAWVEGRLGGEGHGIH